MKFRKKPVVIDACQLPPTGDFDIEPFLTWATSMGLDYESEHDECLLIHTLEGTMTASPGDWIIRGVKGEFYPVKPDIFEATYEAVEA